MNTVSIITFLMLYLPAVLSCSAKGSSEETSKEEVSEKVEVLYFHFTRRCMSCNTVQAVAKNAVEELYARQLQTGEVAFIEVNLDQPEGKAIAERCNVGRQGLVVMHGISKTDLTTQGFRFARSNPDRLKEEIKKAVDPFLTSK